jgi:hypothetical protein
MVNGESMELGILKRGFPEIFGVLSETKYSLPKSKVNRSI